MEPIKSIVDIKRYFQKLPGIGEKTAERLAYATLKLSPDDLKNFSEAIMAVKDKVHRCPNCGVFIDSDECPICSDISRDQDTLLVVNETRNVISFEKNNIYHGQYFVLGGTISPLKNVSPDDVHIPELLSVIDKNNVKEVILALNSTVDGETTALYIAKLLENKQVKVSRLAYGLPLGADLEYVDDMTITRSLNGRVVLSEYKKNE